MTTTSQQDVTNEELARMIKEGFEDIEGRMATKEDLARLEMGLETRISNVETTMVTKDDLTNEIGKLRSDMIDYIAKQNMELKGDLVVLMRGEDRKLCALVELLVEKSVITKNDALRVTKLEPFPQSF